MRIRTIEDWRSQITEQEVPTGGRARVRTSNQADPVMINETILNSEENNLFPPGYSILGSINAERNDTRQLTSQRDEIPGSGVLSCIMEESQDEEPRISVRYSNNVRISVKIPAPEKYDGKPQMDTFEEWMFNMNNFFELSGVPAKQRIHHLPAYLKGKAANFYITHVAPDMNNWTMAKFAKELFVYCFPSNFNELLHSCFDKANQGRRPFTDFGRYMDKLASRLPKVHMSEVPHKIFEGANGYIRTEWRAKGMNYKQTSRRILEETALNYEMAMLEMLKEAARSGRNWRRAMDELGDCPSLEAQIKDKHNQDTFHIWRKDNIPVITIVTETIVLTIEEEAADSITQRANPDEPFILEMTGKTLWKKMNSGSKAPASSINVEELARSVDQRSSQTPVLDIFFAGYKTDFVSEHPEKRRELLKRTKERLIPALWDQVPFRTDIIDIPEIDPLDINKFEIEEWGNALILHDWHTGDDHLLTDEILDNDISDIINGIKTEKLCLLLDNSMLRNEDTLASVGRGNKELFHIPDKLLNPDCTMAEGSKNEVDSEMCLPKLVTISEFSIADDEARWSDNMLKSSNETSDAEQVSQEIYDVVADILAAKVNTGFCNIRDTGEWLKLEIIGREIEVLLTTVYIGDGLWDNDWIDIPWEENSDDEIDMADNSLRLNPFQISVHYYANLAHNWRITEYEAGGPPIHNRFPEIGPERINISEDVTRRDSKSEISIPKLKQLELNVTGIGKRKQDERKEDDLTHILKIERNTVKPKDFKRAIPKSIVVAVKINGVKLRVLLDTGSLADFISSKAVDLLNLPTEHLAKPMTCQLAASGSCSMITATTTTTIEYQDIKEI
ncbi:hypothetical protein M422DRAFT_256572 [Sphaerobolus stellatus SS14]|uniref:Retrotransposon gag domain-containing protein n=1 Tax=Sphaerobolus stellatus (strain SS14) TaxID=990650 RepID=A0A0C9VQR3_SPHS4|nr:hypothetical protein M422DRAFT_256572 [Sphaerobolus stellatus SS14]